MDTFTTLMNTYSLEGIITFLVLIVVSSHMIGKSMEWLWAKAKKKFNIKTDSDKLDAIAARLDAVDGKITTLEKGVASVKERLLQDAKAYIIDQHHYYCYRMGCIDDMSLQLLEVRYTFYVSSGGNSYVGSLMAEIRALPRVSAENIDTVKKEG